MAEMEHCRSCGAAIRWVKTQKGKAMPVDWEPSCDGNLRVILGVAIVLNGEELSKHRNGVTPLYQSHFATCPDAALHRKKL